MNSLLLSIQNYCVQKFYYDFFITVHTKFFVHARGYDLKNACSAWNPSLKDIHL